MAFAGVFGNVRPTNAASCVAQGNTISVNCDFAPGTYYYNGTFTVDAGVTVTAGGATSHGLVTLSADDFVINGSISADGLGNGAASGSCPGASSSTGGGACHGGNGGHSSGNVAGGFASYDTVTGPTGLGSGGGNDTALAGSGGAGGGAIKLVTSATGSVAMGATGLVSANGSKGSVASTNQAGGGSGGSVWIDTGTISGSFFVVTANGGDGTSGPTPATSAGGGGGGGRIVLSYFTNSVSSLTTNAVGGNKGGTDGSSQPGGAGTVYLWDKDNTHGDLIVSNFNLLDSPFSRMTAGDSPSVGNLTVKNGAQYFIGATNTLTVDSGGTITGGSAANVQPQLWITGTLNAPSQALTLSGLNVHQTGTVGVVRYLTYDNGVYSIDTSSALFSAGRGNRLEGLTLSGTSSNTIFSASSTAQLFVDTLTVKSGAVLTHATNTTSAAGIQHQLSVSATTTIDIQSGGSIDVSRKGYTVSEGPGQGADSSGMGQGGGSYGGDGGDASSGGFSSAEGYGSTTQPTDPGSGGGNDTSNNVIVLGLGGGIVKLTANGGAGTITVDGSILAEGGDTQQTASNRDSGGAGGSIWINVPTGTVSGSGTISADGGEGYTFTVSGSGGGGGGRIAIYYSGSLSTAQHAYGGLPGGTGHTGTNGGAGTVYLKANGDTNGTLTLDNNNLRPDSSLSHEISPSSLTVKSLTIRNGARFVIPTATTLTVETNGTVAGGSASGNQPQLWITGTFDAPTEAWTLNGLDIHQTGTVGVLKYLTYDNGVYSVDTSSALFSAGRGNRLERLVLSGTSSNTIFSASSTAQLFVDTLTVKSGAMLTHASNTSSFAHALYISATTSVSVESGGSINVVGRGYTGGEGPGAGGFNGNGCGGANAGNGGGSSQCSGGTAYGSPTRPIEPGSGGGGSSSVGKPGGGFVRVSLASGATVTIDGSINADAGASSLLTTGGGGAGGSVWIDAATNTIAGSGSISANGGDSESQNVSGGGGGRIAIYYTTDSSSWTKSAHGGKPLNYTSIGLNGGAGTIYVKAAAATNGDLFVTNNTLTDSETPQISSTETYDNVTISDGARYRIGTGKTLTVAPGGTFSGGGTFQPILFIDGTFNPPNASQTFSEIDILQSGTLGVATSLTYHDGYYSLYTAGALFTAGPGNRLNSLTLGNNALFSTTSTAVLYLDTFHVQSGAIVTSASNADGMRENVLDVSATSSITIDSGGKINLTATGYAWQKGPCKGLTANVASGAGHGGDGGRGNPSSSGPVGGDVCDSMTQPVDPGSGGGDNTATSGTWPNDGGGATKLSVNAGGTITVNGSIEANGTSTANGGGGAGGAVWINAPSGTVSGSGSISAVGGSPGAGSAGGGGGGRVAVYYSGIVPSFTYDLRGGDGWQDGGAGTLYLKSAAQTNGSLIIDNQGVDSDPFTTQSASNTNITFDDITIRKGGNYRIPSGYTTAIASAADCSGVSGGGPEKGVLTVDGTFNGPNASCTFTDLNVHHNGTIGTITSLTMASGTYAVYTPGALFSAGAGNRLTSLTLNSGGVFSATSTDPFYIDTLTANSGSFLTHSATNTTTGSASNTLYISATTSITIASGATVDLTGLGYDKTVGPGQGTDGTTASGGGHGGAGGTSSIGGAGGTAYDSAEFPTDLGSGGGDDTAAGGTGSQGGGSIHLVAEHGALTISTNIVTDGAAGNAVDDGGGSGGSIFLQAANMTIAGNLSANGGAGASANAGCGGGGRIAVYASASFSYSSGTATAATGCGTARAGVTGSVFIAFADTTPPTVTNVTSTLGDGSYGAGQVVPVTVTFSEIVTVTGTPQILLETGTTDRYATYASGSGSDTLTFNYTVVAGDSSADLDYRATNSLEANGGTIRDAAANDADLTLVAPGTAGSLGYNKAIVISTSVGPTVTSVTHNPDPAEIGQNIVLQAAATDDVAVASIEIYLDGTAPGNLVKTCNFTPAITPATCQYEAGALAAGSHTTNIKAYDDLANLGTGSETFSVANLTSSNHVELSTYKKGGTSTFSLSFSQTSTTSGTLVITFPTGFTVNSALTSGSACLSAFNFTAQTLTATETGCTGAVTMTGASVTNPSAAGAYLIVFTDDNGSGTVYIVDDDTFNISASVDPIITFNVGAQTAACDGAFSGFGGTVALDTLTTSSVATSDVASVPHICMRLSTNAPGGAIVTVLSENAALASVGAPADTIPSSSATLAGGTAGYGLCVGSGGSDTGRDTTDPVGAAPAAAAPFNGSCSTVAHVVGAVTASPQTIWSVNDPTQNAFARVFTKAAISSGTLPHNDYTDVLTFIATATY